MPFKYLKFEDLTLIKDFERKTHNTKSQLDDLEGLTRSIMEIGIKDAFTVKVEGDKYLLCDGYIRYNIIKGIIRLGKRSVVDLNNIPCEVIDRDDISAGQLRFEANRSCPLTPVQTAAFMKDCLDKYKMSVQEIANAYGITSVSVRNHLEIMRCIKPVQEAIENGIFPMSAGKQFCILKANGQEKLYDNLIKRYGSDGKISRKLIFELKKNIPKEMFIKPEKERMEMSEGLRKYKKGSRLKGRVSREMIDSAISKNEIEIRTLERRLDRVREHVIKFLKRWEIAFRNNDLRFFVKANYSDDYLTIVRMIKDELGINIA